jgi:hypothetical protein
MTTETYDPIPETVAEALAKWDAGETVFTVEMGGLGRGYEMAIQGLAFELMRALDGKMEDGKPWHEYEPIIGPIVSECYERPWGGFSGAQVGAAKNLVGHVVLKGYRKALRNPAVAGRLIQVSKKDLR